MKKKKYTIPFIVLVIGVTLVLLLTFKPSVFGRAGGAGGSRGSGGGSFGGGGDGEGGLEIIYFLFKLFIMMPWPGKIIFIIVVSAGGYYYFFVVSKKSRYSSIPDPGIDYKPKSFKSPEKLSSSIKDIDPDFDITKFYNKVRIAFHAIQEGWSKQDLRDARRFISDGVYQRFKIQFNMMQLLEQRNELSNIQLYQTEIVEKRRDKNFDIIQVMIRASMRDSFISRRLHCSTNDNEESFVEYWSLIRKRGVKSNKDMYGSKNCPNCGALLKDLGEIAKCDYCNSIVNNGEYDWVLCEITQADEYSQYSITAKKKAMAEQRVYKFVENDPNFCIQGLEDKASNIFMQYHGALVTGKPECIRRFASDKVYEKIKGDIKEFKDKYIVYNRLYLTDVSIQGSHINEGYLYIHIKCKASIQKAKNNPQQNQASLMDPFQSIITIYLILKRKKNLTFVLSGGLLCHECPNCGASIEDTSDNKCPYCSSLINNGDHDWILDDYLTWYEYQQLYPAGALETVKATAIPKHKNRELKDYILNNVVMILLADGKIDPNEQKHLIGLLKKYNISKDGINNLISLGEQKKLSLMIPESATNRERVYKEMLAIASADNNILIDEKLLLTAFRNRMYI